MASNAGGRWGSVVLVLIVMGTATAQAATYTWTPTEAGTYSWDADPSHWTSGFPNAAGDVANLNIDLADAQTVNLNQTITVGTLNLGDTGAAHYGVTIAPNGGALILDVATGSATIAKATAANNVADTIAANITFNDALVINNAATSGPLTLSGSLSGGSSLLLTKSGGGTLNLSGATTAGSYAQSAGTTASAGSLTINGGSSGYLYVANSGAAAVLDVSACPVFQAGVGIFGVAGYLGATSSAGTLKLGASSTITAATVLRIGSDQGGNTAASLSGTVTTAAGGTTTINTPLLLVGQSKNNSGSFTLGANATLALAGVSGGASELYVGWHYSDSGTGNNRTTLGTLDLSAGTATLMLSRLAVGVDSLGNDVNNAAAGILRTSTNAANHLAISGASAKYGQGAAGGLVVIGYAASSTADTRATTGELTIGNLDAGSALTATDDGTAMLIGYRNNAGSAVQGTVNLNGGTLTITTSGSAIAGGGGTSRLNLNGVVLKAGAPSTAWIQGLTSATLQSGGATLNTAGHDIAIPQAFSGPGGLTKTGAGTLALTGANSFSGPLTVLEGTLGGTSGSAGGGALTNNATLSPGAGGIGTFAHVGAVVLGPASTLRIEVDGANSDAVAVGGPVLLDGSLALALNAAPPESAVYEILTAAGGVTGAFAATNGLPAGWSVVYEPHRVWLTAAPAEYPPAVTNAGATVTGPGAATLTGAYANAARGAVTFCWGTADGGTNSPGAWQSSTNLGPRWTTAFAADIRGLLYPLDYVYRVYATNAYGEGWSDPVARFTASARPPSVALHNLKATNITDTSAWINASLNCSGAVYDVWACWGPADQATNAALWATHTRVGRYSNGWFNVTHPVTELTGDTPTWYTFLASNALDTVWAAPAASFATLDGPPVVTNAGALTDVGRATLRGELLQGNTADVTVYWGRTDGGQTTNWEHAVALPGTREGAFETMVTAGFSAAGYYYTCFASNILGRAWASPSSRFFVAANASNFYWTHTDGGLWSTSGNWTNEVAATGPGVAGRTNYTVHFNAAGTYACTQDLNSGFQLNRLGFGGPDLTLDGNSLALVSNGADQPEVNQNGAGAVAIANALELRAGTTFGGSGTGLVTIAGALAGPGGLTKTSPGALALTGANTFTGGTAVNNGVLTVHATAFSTAARSYAVASNAVLALAGETGLPPGATSISGLGVLRIAGGATVSAGGGGRSLALALGPGALIDLQAGGLLFNGGWQPINWSNNKASINVEGTLNLWDGQEAYVDALNGSGSVENGHGGVTGKGLTVGVNGGSGTFGGVFSSANGPRSLTKNGAGAQVLTGVNTYSGSTIVNGGTLEIGGAGQLGGGTYAAAMVNNAVFFYNSSADQALRGVISGTGSVLKANSGTLTLAGANTYSGPTTVSNGTLLVANTSLSGTGSGAVTVKAGATLGGSGSVAGPARIETGGHLAPGGGDTVGTLSFSAAGLNLEFQDGAILDCKIGGSDLAPTNDTVNLTGAGSTITFGDTATLHLSRAAGATVTEPAFELGCVLFAYGASTPPRLPAWTIDAGDTGWGRCTVSVDAGKRQILLKIQASGTVLLIR